MACIEARRALGAASVSLSAFEREHGRLRTLVNDGALVSWEQTRPLDETYPIGDDTFLQRMASEGVGYVVALGAVGAAGPAEESAREMIASLDKASAMGVPILLEGRFWGSCTPPAPTTRPRSWRSTSTSPAPSPR